MGKKVGADRPLDVLRSLIVSTDRLAVAACHDRGTDVKLRAFLRAAREAAGALGLSPLDVTDAELCQWVDFRPPAAVDMLGSAPVPGSRIVGDHLYRPGPPAPSTCVLAVRKRPAGGAFEVAEGREEWGLSSRSGFQGYRWDAGAAVPNPFPTLEAALEYMHRAYPGAKKTRHLGA